MKNPFSYYNLKRNRARKRGEKIFWWNGKPHESFTTDEKLDMEDAKRKEYQSMSDSLVIAKMIRDFQVEFANLYPLHVHTGLGAVGPLQTLLGLAIKNGHITVNKGE